VTRRAPTIDQAPCPSCRAPMASRDFPTHLDGTVRLDLCYPCRAIWFDRNESMQLAPRAVIELFREIHGRDHDPRRPLAERLSCPRCNGRLELTHDVGRTGPFIYYRCTKDHGRMTPFFQFLQEKHFVRSLNPAELARLRAEVKVVRCSSCGAPVDVQRDAACGYCKAPLAVLDPAAVREALREWSAAEARRPVPSRAKIAAAMLDAKTVEARARAADRWTRAGDVVDVSSFGADIVDVCIDGLCEMLSGADLF